MYIGGLDYVDFNNTEVIFEPGSASTFFDIPILNDLALESIEMFTIILSSSQPNVMIEEDADTATVTITDIDSKWKKVALVVLPH